MLSERQKLEFAERGFLVFDTGAGSRLFDRILAELRAEPRVRRSAYDRGGRVQDAWRHCSAVRELAVLPRVQAMLTDVYGRQPRPFQTLNFAKGTEQAPHSDRIYFDCLPHDYMCGVWVALEDMDHDNGPLVYYPGSHKLPRFDMQDVGVKPRYRNGRRYAEFIAKKIEEYGLQPAYGTIHRGQALLWHANLIHGGASQRDKQRTRHSQVTHYYFAGCRYYTPILSSRRAMHVRNPRWITAGSPGLGHHLGRVARALSPSFLPHFFVRNLPHYWRVLRGTA